MKQTRGTGRWWSAIEFSLWLRYVVVEKLSDVTWAVDSAMQQARHDARCAYFNH